MKVCTRCKKNKELNDFGKYEASKAGLRPACKECISTANVEYNRSKLGKVNKMYNQQVHNSKKRHHPLPTNTKEAFVEAILDMELFHKLYKEWVSSGYDKDLAPSIDRIDNSLPYTEDNITLMTWGENNRKNFKDTFEGNSTQCKPILQLSLSGVLIKEFKSAAIASRVLGLAIANISKVCKGKRKTAGGYVFKYA